MPTVITVENLSKKYLLRHQSGKQPYVALRDVLSDGARNLARRLLGRGATTVHGTEQEEFWALKDVSFEVKQGDRIGIIGRNGAGKSTLLKILSRITEPTTGSVRIKGRVASLLEVGTGFHPELTGRENIYLNGAILGMSRAEIRKKFDEIVDFAEIEKFLDTPVKRYSSGMYVRLAFAVAAHLEPEILVVDEVLAVGDAQFQKKCLGKMEDVSAREGRTVLFVSHNMGAVEQLCNLGVLLENGCVKCSGDASSTVSQYHSTTDSNLNPVTLVNYPHRHGSGEATFESAQLSRECGEPCTAFSIGDVIRFDFKLRVTEERRDSRVKLAIELRSSDGTRLCNMVDDDSSFKIERARKIESLSVSLYDIRFYPDTYHVSLWAGSSTSTETYDFVENCLTFEIVGGGNLTSRVLPRNAGILFLTPEWSRNS